MSVSAITLLHKAYIEIAGKDGTSFPDRNRFMGYAARVMRGLILDHAQSHQAQRRGGRSEITSLGAKVENAENDREFARIRDALDELTMAQPTPAQVVDLKFFCGFRLLKVLR